MPHALLLSPDDQAVSAITAVLEELSVTCERPLDGASAAQKINSQSFDLVLVDCENLPAAKLIFDVCRRGKNGNNPVPIAIVDGRAGLPTAFRLGAELILTKPVAKDQARNTIRSAVGRVRKDVPTNESVSTQPASAAMSGTVATGTVMTGATMTEEHTQAAAAATTSSQLTSFADLGSSPAPTAVSTAATSTLSATATAPKTKTHTSVSPVISVDEMEAIAATAAMNSKPKLPLSDDPVLAELERTELEESEVAESRQPESHKQNSEPVKAAPDSQAAKSGAQVFSSYQRSQQKSRGPQVALLVLTLAVGGFYAAWTYEPGFRTIAQPQIDRLLTLAVMAPPPPRAPDPVKPSAQPAAAPVSAPAAEPSTDASKTPLTASDPTTNSATDGATGSPTTSVAATSSPTSGTTTAAAPIVAKSEPSKPSDIKKETAAATSPEPPLPGESSAIILSSKGAEKRLAHSVPPKYPAAARSGDAQGTVVLKEVVDENGKVAGVRLVEGNTTLATAAISAVKQWRYRPYERDGKAQPFQTVVIIDFQRP